VNIDEQYGDDDAVALLMRALAFATARHSGQTRKGHAEEPYIDHPVAVAHLLLEVGGVRDPELLAAALLHDTVEDTDATLEELESIFGPTVRSFVAEVTDDKTLPKETRKELQVEHAPHLSDAARMIKLCDKICNVRDVSRRPPVGWSDQRRREYLDWTERVIAGCRGSSPDLEELYDRELVAGRAELLG
jgi:guanosine-3',5'-bis(diphosphate) 3'-pyrophosphohydrolase